MSSSDSRSATASGPRSLSQETLGGLLWMQGSVVGQAVLQILVQAILARFVSPEEFGVYAAAGIVIALSQSLSLMGIAPALVQRKSLSDLHVRTGLTFAVVFSSVLVVCTWQFAPLMSDFFQTDELTDVLRVLALAFPVHALGGISQALVTRAMRFQLLALGHLGSYIVGYGCFGIALAALGYGVWALVAANAVQALTQALIFGLAQRHSLRPAWNRPALGELLSYGSGFTLARLANFAAIQGDNIVVGRILGPASLGVYSRAYQIVAMPATLVGRVLNTVLFSSMAKVQDERARLSGAYRRCLAGIALLVMPASAFAVVLAEPLILVLLGRHWTAAVVPLQFLALSLLFRTSYKVSDALANATGAVYRRTWRQIVYAASTIAGAIIGSRWGIDGVAAGIAIAVFINFMLMGQLSLNLVDLRWKDVILAHRAGLYSTVLVAPIVLGSRTIADVVHARPSLVLLIAAVLSLSALRVAWQAAPNLFLGPDGRWLMRLIRERLPRSIRSVLPT